jgi:ubiquinone/menaquinone biosynthesis C-methylase UbiE
MTQTMQLNHVYVVCPLCGADDTDEVHAATNAGYEASAPEAYRCTNPGYGTHDRIVRCRRCHMVYSNPRLTSDAILDSYKAVEDPIYLQEEDGRRLTFLHHAKHMERILGAPAGRNLLDVGCYTGVFVEVARARGWKGVGLEPSHWAVAYARSRGLPVLEGTLVSSAIKDESQDVVTLWDVIEHLPDPLGELQQVARVVKPGGWAVLHTMDIDSLAARAMRQRWPWLMQMHLVYFSQRTLGAMLRKVGFEPVRSQAMGRYLRLGYFASRVAALSPKLGDIFSSAVDAARLRELPIPLNFGDLFTVYARKL